MQGELGGLIVNNDGDEQKKVMMMPMDEKRG
jgi:hypothetical protein